MRGHGTPAAGNHDGQDFPPAPEATHWVSVTKNRGRGVEGE